MVHNLLRFSDSLKIVYEQLEITDAKDNTPNATNMLFSHASAYETPLENGTFQSSAPELLQMNRNRYKQPYKEPRGSEDILSMSGSSMARSPLKMKQYHSSKASEGGMKQTSNDFTAYTKDTAFS
jgi:hypothetical protein